MGYGNSEFNRIITGPLEASNKIITIIESLVKGYSLSERSKTMRTKQVILANIRTLQEFLIGITNRTNYEKMQLVFKHHIIL